MALEPFEILDGYVVTTSINEAVEEARALIHERNPIEARRLISEVMSRASTMMDYWLVASTFARLGDVDQTGSMLQKAIDAGSDATAVASLISVGIEASDDELIRQAATGAIGKIRDVADATGAVLMIAMFVRDRTLIEPFMEYTETHAVTADEFISIAYAAMETHSVRATEYLERADQLATTDEERKKIAGVRAAMQRERKDKRDTDT